MKNGYQYGAHTVHGVGPCILILLVTASFIPMVVMMGLITGGRRIIHISLHIIVLMQKCITRVSWIQLSILV
ncbi:unnamed protein product [Allacma fusca]|uniref:Uncharacterized protein n=1 Tax=Allacma fusca TaxID=39272 RepID=A0A8J2KL11_9HEXA|nr:unnamed protein product [Allacma fusca]